jgi:hypothetical protein
MTHDTVAKEQEAKATLRAAAEAALKKRFDEWVANDAPEFAPEFERHRAWAEQFAWSAVRDICRSQVMWDLGALSQEPPAAAPAQGEWLSAFDAAIAAELPRVSHVEYDSHEICKHFAAEVRKRLAQPPAEGSQT